MDTPATSSAACEPIAAMTSLSVHEDNSVNPNCPDKKVRSTSLVSDTTISSNGQVVAPAAGIKEEVRNGQDTSFVKGQDGDDVFGNNDKPANLPNSDAIKLKEDSPAQRDDKLTTPATKQAPRADRVGSPITPANAQGVLPPEACVFVANLSMVRSDEQLEFSCHQAFDLFGNCLVKVRRDRHKHPFALVQYYSADDAHRAVQGAHDLVIDGRRIRTEPAQAKRSVILVKLSGGTPSVEETRKALEQYGPIDKLSPTTHADARKFGCPEGMWLEFAYYLDYKDALKYFNSTNTLYRLYVPPEVEPRLRASHAGHNSFNGFRSPRSSTDQKSIFLGNLPHDTSEDELREMFAGFGEIKAVNIIHKPVHGTGFNIFGFIEFATPYEAEQAAHQEIDIRGRRIRVEPKEYSARRHTRLQQYAPMTPFPGGRYGYSMMNPHFSNYQHLDNSGFFHGSQGFSHGSQGFGMHQNMTPYHNAYNMFQSPPPTGRMHRRNSMVYGGSPNHGMHMFTPASLPPPPFGMEQIDENTYENAYGDHQLYQNNYVSQ